MTRDENLPAPDLAALDHSMNLWLAEHPDDWMPANLTPLQDAECVMDPVDDLPASAWGTGLCVLAVVFLVPWVLIAGIAWGAWLLWAVVS